MKTAELGLRYWHYKNNGVDLLKITHEGKTLFADPDRLREKNKSWSLQRVSAARI